MVSVEEEAASAFWSPSAGLLSDDVVDDAADEEDDDEEDASEEKDRHAHGAERARERERLAARRREVEAGEEKREATAGRDRVVHNCCRHATLTAFIILAVMAVDRIEVCTGKGSMVSVYIVTNQC